MTFFWEVDISCSVMCYSPSKSILKPFVSHLLADSPECVNTVTQNFEHPD